LNSCEKEVETTMPSQSEKSQPDMEWEARTLCSDEGCIGVIGPDGRCLECGHPYEGHLPDGFAGTVTAAAPSVTEEDGARDAPPAGSEDSFANEPLTADDAWEARELCPDESCIGVIGPDRRCLECGRSAQDG
jgi:hypothetical protein